jgi:hypothetical protein
LVGVSDGDAGGGSRSQKADADAALAKEALLVRSSGGGVAVAGKQVAQWTGLSWVQRMVLGPWVSQKCARESWLVVSMGRAVGDVAELTTKSMAGTARDREGRIRGRGT